MPIIASAKKKMRQDKKRRLTNLKVLNELKETILQAKKTPSAEALKRAYSAISRAAKKKILHKNKAARLKSRLAKKISQEKPPAKTVPVKKEKKA